MKVLVLALGILAANSLFAQTNYGYLNKEDQQYYKNDFGDGNNQRERIDSTVKEINKLHGEIATLKSDVAILKQEIAALKAAKK